MQDDADEVVQPDAEAELVEEKFLEDEALLGGRAKSVQGVNGFAGFRKVRGSGALPTSRCSRR